MGLGSAIIGFFFLFLLYGAVPIWAIWFIVRLYKDKVKSAAIHNAFQQARDLRGKTFEEIVGIGGEPLESYDYPGAKRVAIFGHTHFKVVLVFRNGLCEGVNREIIGVKRKGPFTQ